MTNSISVWGFTFRITAAQVIREHLVLVLQMIFISVSIGIATFLWKAVFRSGTGFTEGYNLNSLLWYLVASQSLSSPAAAYVYELDAEVRNGTMGFRMISPYPDLAVRFFMFLGQRTCLAGVSFAVGSTLAWLVSGAPARGLVGVLYFLPTSALSTAIMFAVSTIVGLSAMWVAETRLLQFAFSRLLLLFGGTLIPLNLLPSPMRQAALATPLRLIAYDPARLLVRGTALQFAGVLGAQLAVVGALAALCWSLLDRGVRHGLVTPGG